MTLWIDDGTDDGFLANCGNCVFAVEDPTEDALTCGWDPPTTMRTRVSLTYPAGFSTWQQPLAQPDMHCHHHPDVQQVRDFGRGWQKGLRRTEDRGNQHSPMTTSENTARFPGNDVPPIHCVKCRTKTNNATTERVTLKNGRPAIKATCADCGTGKFRIGG